MTTMPVELALATIHTLERVEAGELPPGCRAAEVARETLRRHEPRLRAREPQPNEDA